VSTTDIQLTANSRLFLAQPFTLAKGQQILGLDLNGLNIVEEGAGGYVWTPQLGADLNLTDFPAQAAGAVAEVFADDTFDLLLGDASALYVDAAPASVWLPDGTQGGLDDLDAGDEVRVEGVMFIDGKLEAAAVRILTQAPPA
jgi:hypothetical protein